MSEYIDDPIVIRKSRGALIVSSSKESDPIQLVRQVSHKELEVHLKNGHKYIEDVGDADMQQIILEMMGYAPHELIMKYHAWPSCEEGALKIITDHDKLQVLGARACGIVFSPTPYLNSKFLNVELSHSKQKRVRGYSGQESEYYTYDVIAKFRFHCRVDMAEEVANAFYEEAFHYIVKQFFVLPQSVSANDIHTSIRMLE